MPRRTHLFSLVAIVALAGSLRTVWLTADPPVAPPVGPVGIVWHDEGAWVHNARNRALWGVWRTDEWNPMFLTPVFTAIESAAFSVWGVGTWQARTVPAASGLVAVLALAWGLGALAGRRAAIVGSLLLATNYFFVMWNRAALIESTMTAAIVVSWAGYAAARRRPPLGVFAGLACVAAFFTKASAAFFVAALVLDAGLILLAPWLPFLGRIGFGVDRGAVGAARWTIAGVAAGSIAAWVVFVGPYWSEYSFYTWQMSVARKPSYAVGALVDRASWLPVLHDVFTRMWLVLLGASVAMIAIVSRWRSAAPAARVLVLWMVVGLAELIVHDSGNERRFVMFVPALVALAALLLTRDETTAPSERGSRSLALPVSLLFSYLVWGSLVRLLDLPQIQAHDLSWTVRVSAALALLTGAVIWWRWQSVTSRLARWRPSRAVAVAAIAIVVAIDLAQFGVWAARRTYFNYAASTAVGQWLAPDTPVHGKLANGLALENRIRPLFIGRGFGNYADRLSRDDVRFLLTYVSPYLGYEGAVIHDVLRHYPSYRILNVIAVDETPDHDAAALVDKFPERPPLPVR